METVRSVILDTNSYSKLFVGDKSVEKDLTSAERVYISVIVLGELYHGFLKGKFLTKNEIKLYSFLKKPTVRVINVSFKTAKIYAEVKNKIWKKGSPIPTDDIWIAAHAIETNSTLITYDRHFLEIPGVKLWKDLR